MNIIQDFYNNLASQYDKLFFDWESATKEQATILNKLFTDNGFDKTANILDCAFGANTSPTIKDFDEFLEDRSIPKTRHHFSMQCAMHGISDTSVLGIVKHFQGRCAGDSYWINFLD